MSRFLPVLVLMFVIVSPPSSADPVSGRDIYNFHCYFCHGYSGDAETLAATMLSPPPRNFTAIPGRDWDPVRMRESVRSGRPGTAMPSFGQRLGDEEIAAVVDFIGASFVEGARDNILYHSPENGWSSTQFDSPAAAFVTGAVSLSKADADLSDSERAGKRIYLGSCVSCHDSVAAPDETLQWQPRPVSFPRGHYSHRAPDDAVSGATPYSRHDVIPAIGPLDPLQARGQRLYQANCAFCHAADGSGRNWIGSFLEPPPRNLGGPRVRSMDDAQLARRIADGLPGTSMPAWRHVLQAEDIEAIVAYVRRAFDHPPARAADSRN